MRVIGEGDCNVNSGGMGAEVLRVNIWTMDRARLVWILIFLRHSLYPDFLAFGRECSLYV